MRFLDYLEILLMYSLYMLDNMEQHNYINDNIGDYSHKLGYSVKIPLLKLINSSPFKLMMDNYI